MRLLSLRGSGPRGSWREARLVQQRGAWGWGAVLSCARQGQRRDLARRPAGQDLSDDCAFQGRAALDCLAGLIARPERDLP